MAQTTRRVNSRSDLNRNSRQLRYTWEDGNAVRQPEWIPPGRSGTETDRKRQTPKQRQPQRQTGRKRKAQTRTGAGRRTRTRAGQRLGAGYVLFLSAVCAVTVLFCIYYLQLKSQITTQSAKIVVLESNLSRLQADNDAYYKKAMASVSMDEVRETAIDRLGMHYPSQSQIRYYSTDDNSYVRQYRNVP